jgi:hypothetical protein
MIESGLGLPSQSFRGGGGEHLAKIVEYFLIFGGLPWSRGLHALSEQAIVGGVVWLVVAAAALGALRRRDWRPPTGAGLALIAFGLMAASMAAVGRVDELPTPIVPTRYTPFATLLQIGAVLASAPLWRGVDARRPFALAAAVGFVLIVVAGTYPTGVRGLQRTASRIHAAGELFDRTGRQDEVVLHPRPAFAADVRRELARRGLPH